MQFWTQDEIKFIADNIHLSTKDIYLLYRKANGEDIRSYDSIQKKTKKLREAYEEDPIDEVSLDAQVESMLNNETQELVIPDVNAARKRELRDEAKWWLEGIIEASHDTVVPPYQVPQGTETSLCVLVSDCHIGKHNEHFSLSIGRERIESIPRSIPPSAYTVDEVVVMLMGDIVEGEDIYTTQAHHIDCPAIEQVKLATEALWEMILAFRNRYECPVRVETVPGNHGRMSKTANEKTNWDNVVYHILRVMAAKSKEPGIIVNCNFDTFRILNIKDKTGMLYHQGVKHTGTPAMREKVAGWSSRKNFDFMCHGHWHEWHVGNWLSRFVIANGCLCGPDDLAERMAKEDTARQGYFYVTPGQPLHSFGVVEWK